MTGTEMTYVVDSCPIIPAKQRKSSHAKIAPELCDKGYNSSKDEYYYGVKLHTFATWHTGTLPTACAMMVSRASDHDLPIARQIMDAYCPFRCGTLYADKAYIDEDWEIVLDRDYSVRIFTPRKQKKMISCAVEMHFPLSYVLYVSRLNAFSIGSTPAPISYPLPRSALLPACLFISSAELLLRSSLAISTLDSHLYYYSFLCLLLFDRFTWPEVLTEGITRL